MKTTLTVALAAVAMTLGGGLASAHDSKMHPKHHRHMMHEHHHHHHHDHTHGQKHCMFR